MSVQRILGDWWSSSPTTNPSLKGHQLLLISPTPPAPEWVDKVKAQHPHLDIVHVNKNPFGLNRTDEGIDWSDVTVLLSGPLVPTIEQSPKLKLVQLQSAGANYLLDNPLFKDTDVAFSTANGVHGGILGYGSIGRQVARVAKALGMDVLAYTNGRRLTPESRKDTGYIVPGTGDPEGVFPSRWLSGADNQFEEFLSADLDVLVVAVPLTASTKGLISGPEFKLLAKNKTFLSNIARGPVVDTDALIKALDDKSIRGAALDVTDPEPLPDGHPLWSKPNTIVTPHISGNSNAYNKRVYDILELNLQRLSEGKDFVNQVNKREGY